MDVWDPRDEPLLTTLLDKWKSEGIPIQEVAKRLVLIGIGGLVTMGIPRDILDLLLKNIVDAAVDACAEESR